MKAIKCDDKILNAELLMREIEGQIILVTIKMRKNNCLRKNNSIVKDFYIDVEGKMKKRKRKQQKE